MKNIGIFYIGIGRYIELYEGFKKSFDKYFLLNCNKHYYIITDDHTFKCGDDEELIFVKNDGWPASTLKRFEYFLKCDVSKMDYVFYFNGNSMAQCEVEESDIIPTEEENYLCGVYLYFHKIMSPYDRNPDSSCYMTIQSNYAFRGGLLGGRTKEFMECCKACVEMIKQNGNYIPKWHDEAYFNKYVENLNIKKIKEDVFSYINYGHPKIFTRLKKKIFGNKFLRDLKGKEAFI